jgi:hypothetical protein
LCLYLQAFPYKERRMHVAYLQKLLTESDWLRSAGVADQIVARQRVVRAEKEEERKKEEAALKRKQAHAAELRRQEEVLGMVLADKESKAYEDGYDEWVRQQEEKRAAEEKRKLNARRLAMIREDEASAKVEVTYRAYLIEKERQRMLAKDREARARERAGMTEAARDCRYWNDLWSLQDEKRRDFDLKVSKAELLLMEEEEEHSTVMNRVWRRIGKAQDFTRAFNREKARREAAGLPQQPSVAGRTAGQEDEATAEREAVREFFIELGVLQAEPAVVTASSSRKGHDSDEEFYDVDGEGEGAGEDGHEYDGEVARGRNGWVALTTEEGYLYYCNDDTGETQWEKPDDF